ncbi:MAG: transcriptional repressor [Oscillospiraceae bacterium]|nr:transcriptional repressor [Oscillospiraceae bacterium]
MANKIQYKTRHRDELLAYLRTIPGEHFTVAEVVAAFERRGQSIGTTTVYRQLERMVGEGLVTKYIIDAGSPACFEYVGGAAEHACGEACYHCKCEVCGALIHLHCDELPALERHIRAEHGFSLDPARTVFYGVCAKCAEGQMRE